MESSGTVDKAVRALHAIKRRGGLSSLADLASDLSIPKPTVHRLLVALLRHELVEQRLDGRYALGVGLLRLGLGAQRVDPLAQVARLELERAAERTGETFFLVLARAGKLVVLDKVEGRGVLRAAPEIGAEVPVDRTATGRLYRALAPQLVAGSKVASDDPHVERARERGYDVNRGEWIEGLTVVAAPIVAAPHGLCGCVAAAVVQGAAGQVAIEALIEQAKASALAVARKLEGRGVR